jgi:hypothetical protein
MMYNISLPEGGDRIQSPKRCVLKNKQAGDLDKVMMMMDNLQKHNICSKLKLFRF